MGTPEIALTITEILVPVVMALVTWAFHVHSRTGAIDVEVATMREKLANAVEKLHDHGTRLPPLERAVESIGNKLDTIIKWVEKQEDK